jgi:hypothetical protein
VCARACVCGVMRCAQFRWLTLLLSFEFIFEPVPRSVLSRRRFMHAVSVLVTRNT